MSRPIILSRYVKPEWLDLTVEYWTEYQDPKRTRERLNRYLAERIESLDTLSKTREILIRTWVEVEDSLVPLRDLGVSVYFACPVGERAALHWTMMLAAFPLFRDVCGVIGKLASLQSEFTTSQIRRRIFELWGERATLLYALEKNIRTLREFGAIRQLRPGIYERGSIPVHDHRVVEFMLYGTIMGGQKLYQSIAEFERKKELFPFEFEANLEQLIQSQRIKLDRVGGELVASL